MRKFLLVLFSLSIFIMLSSPTSAEATSCHRCSKINGCQMTDFESNDNCENPAGTVTRYRDASCNEITGGDNTMCAENPYVEANNPVGSHDAASCTEITGWACDNDNPNYPIDVAIFKNGNYFNGGVNIGSTKANQPRESAVGNYCNGTTAHGFTFTVPAGTLANGETVFVHALNIGKGTTNPLIWNTGKAVSCQTSSTAPPPIPQPERTTCTRCSKVNGCEWTEFQSTDNCVNPSGEVNRSTDAVNCKAYDTDTLKITGGNNDRCPVPPPVAPSPSSLPSCSGAAPDAVTISETKSTVTVQARGVKNATQVRFPTWTAYTKNGSDQDDLKWNNGTKVASDPTNGDTWQYQIPLSEYDFGPTGKGMMNVHVYMDNASKSNEWCGSANFNYLPSSTNSPPPPAAPVCQPIPGEYASSIDLLVNTPTTGAYTVWVRMMKPNDGANSIFIKTDTDCPVAVNMKSGLPDNSWQWVNYKNGDPNNIFSTQFKQGDQFIKLAGKSGVKVDKVMMLNNGCTPEGTGDNCTSFIPAASTDESAHNPTGWQDAASCEVISGWTCDPDEPNTALSVHFYKGASAYDTTGQPKEIIGTVTAKEDRVDLISNGNVCNGTKAHGFTFKPDPGKLQNGDKVFAHAINVGRGTTNPLIPNTGSQVICRTTTVTNSQSRMSTPQTRPQAQVAAPVQTLTGFPELSITSPLVLSKTTLTQGQEIAGTVTFTNTSSVPAIIEDLYIAGRTPTDEKADFSPHISNKTLNPGESVVLTATKQISTSAPAGTWSAFTTYILQGKSGYADDIRRIPFTVVPAPENPSTMQTILSTPGKVARTVVDSAKNLVGIETTTPTPSPTGQPNDVFVQPSITAPVQTRSNQTSLTVSLQLHGIGRGGDSANANSGGNRNPHKRSLPITIELLKNDRLLSTNQGRIAYDTKTGLFSGTIKLNNNVQTDTYTIRVKVARYLKKLYPSAVQITQKMTTILPPMELVAGDINNDNKIDNSDTTLLLGCVSSGISQPKNCNTENKVSTDITDDGKVNSEDYLLLLRENNVKQGD